MQLCVENVAESLGLVRNKSDYIFSTDCIINVDLGVADQCQYWLEGIILVSFNSILIL